MSEALTDPGEALDIDALLDTWFGATRTNPDRIPERLDRWFQPDPDWDAELEARFGAACRAAENGRLDELAGTAQGRLALILLLDQFPRNLYRGTARAFACDDQALAHCLQGHATGQDLELSLIERVFFWLPLQHAEDLERQELSVQLYTGLAVEDGDATRDAMWQDFAGFAERHHDIIQRFGRFPHRNAALGRASTDREADWLEAGGETFGQ